MRRILFPLVLIFVGACIEKGGRPRSSSIDARSGDLQGSWQSRCESWGDSAESGSSQGGLLVTGSAFTMVNVYSRQNDCSNTAVSIQSNMTVTALGSGEYPRTIDLKYGKMLGTIYDAELLDEANQDSDCGVWQLGVAKDLAECDAGDEPPVDGASDTLYQIYGIDGQELRFGLMEWNSQDDSFYDGSSPDTRPRVLSDYEIFYRAGSYNQAMLP